jgi:lipopolysaccharide/colanic/teichoic acid biosynthesis glycosyltransferase
VASFLLVMLSPLLLLVALLIKLTSPGSVIFRQVRCGLGGRRFVLYKFRSMIVEAEEVKSQFNHLNEMSGPVFKLSNDPRCTLLGKWLRKFSIDELPQLVNILKGDMSFVGPRPPIPEEVEKYERWQRRRLRMKPGLTCLWQVRGRNDIDFGEWMKLDLQYIDTWSLLLDLKICLKTIPIVLLGKGR